MAGASSPAHHYEVNLTPSPLAPAPRNSTPAFLSAVSPTAIEVALAVQQDISQRVEQAASLRDKRLQRARYEAELARRRYLKVDPDNRLVADALEADWNGKLRDLDALQREHERQNETDQSLLDGAAQERIRALAADFPSVWSNERTQPVVGWLATVSPDSCGSVRGLYQPKTANLL
ncbi:hypothetical protein PY650_33545 [Rhizobium calliandrae]|uniref:Uncharacterized protein n=1 Tax=Rhizobium calliandrae TaxID=1312182 RepID=A0ABT7KP70_9HYPH|nr:hypothetical protein [Rhizobium calliandrae]MDL2410428.1 hypothetical protein [Rhizobium calliandrae]